MSESLANIIQMPGLDSSQRGSVIVACLEGIEREMARLDDLSDNGFDMREIHEYIANYPGLRKVERDLIREAVSELYLEAVSEVFAPYHQGTLTISMCDSIASSWDD